MKKEIMAETISNEIEEHKNATKNLSQISENILYFSDKIISALKKNNKILICGNGGSAADAQHFSSELICKYEKKRKSLPALSLSTDPSTVTAISNDYGYKYLFSRQIEGLGNKGDILILITTSGNSENLIEAAKTARSKSLIICGLLGRDGGAIKNFLDFDITINNKRTSRIQEMHSLIIHIICKLIDESLEK